jgi:parvulin-like peptidyl-prolyl isomerase
VKYGLVLSTGRRLLPILALAAAGALLAGCGGSSGKVSGDAVAVAGTETVSKSDFDTLIRQQKLTYKQQKRPFPKAGTKAYNTLRDQITAYLVRTAELQAKASDMGVKVTDKEINDALTKFKQQSFGGDEKKYVAARNAQGLTEDDVKKNERVQLVANKLFTKVTASVKISDADAKAYYDKNKSQFVTQASRTVRHILVAAKDKKLADKLYAQLVAGADFAKLAKKYSKDKGSAVQGGKLTITKGQTVPEFEATAFKIKTGAIAKPVKTQFGWHIIQALSPVKKASFVPFAKVSPQIKQQLASTKKNDVMTKWVTNVQKDYCNGKVKYGKDFQPLTDPCKALTTTTSTAASTPATTTG